MQERLEGGEKSFGWLLAIIFLLISVYPLIHGGVIRGWALLISMLSVFVVYIFPSLLRNPYKLWMSLGMLLGNVVSPIVMAIIFFGVVFPIGVIMKLSRKDILSLKWDDGVKTYWVDRKGPESSMKNQF